MRKWVFAFILVILLSYGISQLNVKSAGEDKVNIENGSLPTEDSQVITVGKEQVHQGDLLLVNNDHALHPEGIRSDIVSLSDRQDLVQGFGLLDPAIQLSESVAKDFGEMVKGAKQDGVEHFLINSGYRDAAKQDQLYRDMGHDYALPAYHSEHNLGLSLDIGSTEAKMDDAEEGKWLKKHAWEYGFILRYPKGKEEITGIQYEPWHFRYVGKAHSAIMYHEDLTLEQYLDKLKMAKAMSIKTGGIQYTVAYYPMVGSSATVQVPKGQQYDISGNNYDGVIVTSYV
ncbi:M15 family metallopeptidase [Paenibacillus glycanilyticus]|uniref:D-Ala-D-Ala carboxypeptidase VanY n=1 Tax=Paenibacillus glycanilyticus TaxID=126569 RepID=A0ABQ6GGH2_9BACL|nr:M15 family metallopeptidase [Paenibacillus glycanilyticus]GLX69928.1 D-Ala-D-Ala carboxypeptidase VanY [Paenibacillus glycanilyticus]